MFNQGATPGPCVRELERSIYEKTYGRIRNLSVLEQQGRIVVRGHVPSHHTRQLALHAALDVLPGNRLSAQITVS
jgi:hypothetical protein